jgi:hypothetical protein
MSTEIEKLKLQQRLIELVSKGEIDLRKNVEEESEKHNIPMEIFDSVKISQCNQTYLTKLTDKINKYSDIQANIHDYRMKIVQTQNIIDISKQQIKLQEDHLATYKILLIQEIKKIPYLYCIQCRDINSSDQSTDNSVIEVGCWSSLKYAEFYLPGDNKFECGEFGCKYILRRKETNPFVKGLIYECQVVKKETKNMDSKTLNYIDLHIPDKDNKYALESLYCDFRNGREKLY